MLPANQIGRYLIGLGLILVVVGVVVILSPKIPIIRKLGQLPGDIRYQNKDGNFTVFAPIVSSILVSLLLTIIINIILRIFRK